MSVFQGFLLGLMVSWIPSLSAPEDRRRQPDLQRDPQQQNARAVRAASAISHRSRPEKREPEPYRGFVISPDEFAIAVHIIAADHDAEALERAMKLQGELRIELWCGSRKVADVPSPA